VALAVVVALARRLRQVRRPGLLAMTCADRDLSTNSSTIVSNSRHIIC
jgi:hypothetical protein